MKARGRVQSRVYIDNKTRELVSKKTKGVCSHCGCKIRIGDNFSVDHAVPLNIGGTNDIENLVPLCKDCNFHKDDKLMPIDWYCCLNKVAKKELGGYIKKYESTHSSIGYNYFLAYDKLRVGIYEMFRNGKEVKINRVIKKAYYSDLDRIYLEYISYFDKVDIKYTKDEIKQQISNIFINGAFYITDDLSLILPVVPYGTQESGALGILFWYPITRSSTSNRNLCLLDQMIYKLMCSIQESLNSEDDGVRFVFWFSSKEALIYSEIAQHNYGDRYIFSSEAFGNRCILSLWDMPMSVSNKSVSEVNRIEKKRHDKIMHKHELFMAGIRKQVRENNVTGDFDSILEEVRNCNSIDKKTPVDKIEEFRSISKSFKSVYKQYFVYDFAKDIVEGLETGLSALCYSNEMRIEYENGKISFHIKGDEQTRCTYKISLDILRNIVTTYYNWSFEEMFTTSPIGAIITTFRGLNLKTIALFD